MNPITKYEKCLPYISEEVFKNAQENLSSHMKQKSFFRDDHIRIYNGISISNDFTG